MEQSYKATVSIAGTCILRDTFSSHKDDGGYKVQRYISRFSPLSLCEPPVPVDQEAYLALDLKKYIPAFSKRCILQDLTRTAIDFLRDQKSDWLLVDATLCRSDYFQFGEEKYSCHGAQQFIFDDMARHHILPPVTDVKQLFDFSEVEIERRMRNYIDQLLSLYSPEQIILVENQNVELYCDKNNTITAFVNQKAHQKENQNIQYCHQLMKKMLVGCHYIPFPKYVIANADHWLGKSPLHYTQAYYDYAFQAVEVINQHLPREQETTQIQQLCTACSAWYMNRYMSSLTEAVLRLSGKYWSKQKECTTYLQYSDYFTAYLQNGKDAAAFFKEKGIHQIGVYGYNRIANYFIPTLEEAGIHVRFVVENLSKQKQNELFPTQPQPFSILSRNATAYPKVDAVLITDLFNYDKLQKKIPTITKAPIYTIHDFL